MSLRHALLALLETCAMTGYELAKQFDLSVTFVWHARHSQIYPELRRLEQEGLVRAEAVARGAHAIKRTYSITEAGCAALEEWVDRVEAPARERDAAYLKATYLEFGSYDAARRQFEEHRDHYRRQQRLWEDHVRLLERRDTDLMRLRLSNARPDAQESIVAYKVHVYRGLVERARTEVRWAKDGLALVDRLEREAGRTPGARVEAPHRPRRKPPGSALSA